MARIIKVAFTMASFNGQAFAGGNGFLEKQHQNKTQDQTSRKLEGDGTWTLNGDQGPWCDSSLVPAWETPGAPGDDGGWDICCYASDPNDPCDITTAYWDPPPAGPLKTGQWCDGNFGWDHGSCWDEENGFWQFWYKGVVYDDCGCVPGDVGNGPEDWKQLAYDGTDTDAWLAGQCDVARPICSNGGYITNPLTHPDKGDCEQQGGHIYQDHDNIAEGICWPVGDVCVDENDVIVDCP